MEPIQSAYCKHHSMESCLLKIKTDILDAIDNQKVTALILLDASAAFDTIHHDILLQGLKTKFGFRGTVLKWMESYIRPCRQRVVIDGAKSKWITLDQGIAQGSVLRPIAFTLYMSPLGNICRENDVHAQFFADDKLMYLAFKPKKTDSQEQCITTLEKCISETKTWMGSNRLRLNDDKIEFIIIGSRQQLSKITDIAIIIGNTTIQPVETVCDLGYFLDNQL